MSMENKGNNATMLHSKFLNATLKIPISTLDTYAASQTYVLLKARTKTVDIYKAQIFCRSNNYQSAISYFSFLI